jgi:DNA primase
MISPKTIALIRDRTDLVALVQETVKLARKGRSFLGLCPFHSEKTPSFNVNPERGFYHCFGCKDSGNAFDFVMKTEGLTFPEAARQLAARGGIEIEETATDAERREADAERRATDELFGVNGLAAHWFETQLREHPLARIANEELRRRGLGDDGGAENKTLRDVLQAFRIGYAPAGWDGLASYLAQQSVSPVAASNVGLIAARKSSPGYYDVFRHRLMFAIVDLAGRVVGFSGRVLPDPETGLVDKQTGKYVNSAESQIYQKGHSVFGLYQARQSIRQSEEAVLVEGNFDVVSLHARGITNVVAPLGTAFTVNQAKLVRRYAPAVTLLFDADPAGRKATEKARDVCRDANLHAKVAVLPDGKDPDAFVRERGPDDLRACIRAARGILEHLIEAALDQSVATVDSHERAGRVREVVDLIASEPDPTVRAMGQTYADKIAQRIGLSDVDSFRALRASISRTLSSAEPPPAGVSDAPFAGAPAAGAERPEDATPWRARSRDQRTEIALAILGCFLDFPDLLDDPDAVEAAELLEGELALAVAALRQAMQTPGQGAIVEFLAHLPDSIHTFAARRLAAPRHDEREQASLELISNAQKLKRLGLSRQKAQVVEALFRVERTGDRAAEEALLREMDCRAREKHGQKKG